MTLAMGVLSALTTGYWGSLSDRVGRTKITAVVETGLMLKYVLWSFQTFLFIADLYLSEMCFILVATFPYLAPGGYRALLIGPTIDGLLGGFSTISATIHAYLSDVTPDGSRATVFARLGGIMMTGFACGPVLGSFVIRWTDNMYVAGVLHSDRQHVPLLRQRLCARAVHHPYAFPPPRVPLDRSPVDPVQERHARATSRSSSRRGRARMGERDARSGDQRSLPRPTQHR